MKFKKFLSLLLSVASLNLATNFSHCFGMAPDNYSATVVTRPGYTNCPISGCGAQRPSKIRSHEDCYALPCPVCGSYSRRPTSYRRRSIAFPNSFEACRYCGCRRFMKNSKKLISSGNIQSYMCSNCKKTGFKEYLSYNGPQLWKKGFCPKNCEHIDGYITSKFISGNKNLIDERIKKEDRIKSILCSSNGFDYYCYDCHKWEHITLTKEEAEHVCAEYDECLDV